MDRIYILFIFSDQVWVPGYVFCCLETPILDMSLLYFHVIHRQEIAHTDSDNTLPFLICFGNSSSQVSEFWLGEFAVILRFLFIRAATYTRLMSDSIIWNRTSSCWDIVYEERAWYKAVTRFQYCNERNPKNFYTFNTFNIFALPFLALALAPSNTVWVNVKSVFTLRSWSFMYTYSRLITFLLVL